MLNIMIQWQEPEILNFVIRVYYGKLGHMLKPLVPRFRPDLSVRLRDIAEKQVPAKMKPIVGGISLCRTDRDSGRSGPAGRKPDSIAAY